MKSNNAPQVISRKELSKMLYSLQFAENSNIFASIWQLTEPKCVVKHRDTKAPNPYIGAKKLSYVNVCLNVEYSKRVVNQLAKENKEATEYQQGKNTMPLDFGENNIFIGKFKDKDVVQYAPTSNEKLRPRVKYYHNGKEISKNEIAPFLPVVHKAENQGTDKEIIWRKVYLDNILKININGKRYVIDEVTI
jgi:hypothetical protein